MWASIATVLVILQLVARPSSRSVLGRLRTGPLDGWVHFDGPEYLAIASQGYQQRQLVWFPLYPLLIRVLTPLTRDATLAAVGISAAAGLAATVLFWRWAEGRLGHGARSTAVTVLLVYPYGWFLYGVVYSDALFLALVLGAFVLAERDRWATAAALGALATATRPSGAALVLGLVVMALERDGVLRPDPSAPSWVRALRLPTRVDPARLRGRSWLPLGAVLGLLAYCAYQWIEWGSPVRFATEQGNYHEAGDASLLKLQYFSAWDGGFDGRHLATTTVQAVLLLVVLVSVPAVGRRFGWGYATYVLALATLPAVTVSTFMGVGRYLLPAFPCFALLGEALSRHRGVRWAYLAASALAMGVMAFGFSRNWYLT